MIQKSEMIQNDNWDKIVDNIQKQTKIQSMIELEGQKTNQYPTSEINISITKIFNWSAYQRFIPLELEFFSKKTGGSLIKKEVRGEVSSNALNLNTLLRITYTHDEKIIMMSLYTVGVEKNMLGEFQIDLEELVKKKIQYFSFGRDQVLQISIVSERELTERSRLKLSEYYTQERDTCTGRKLKEGMKKSFSDKVLTLLREVHELKGKPDQYIPPSTSRIRPPFKKEQPLSSMPKSNSQKRLHTQYGLASNQAQTKSQKHKLLLSTLHLVPSEEYFTLTKPTHPSGWRQSRQYH